MATLSPMDPSIVFADRRHNVEYLQYSINAVTFGDEWNHIDLNIPTNILEGVLINCNVETRNAPATARNLDAQREVCQLSLRVAAQLSTPIMAPVVAVSEPISNSNLGVGAPGVDAWATEFRDLAAHFIRLTRDDILQLHMPPADDNSTPTADYFCRLILAIGKYTKK